MCPKLSIELEDDYNQDRCVAKIIKNKIMDNYVPYQVTKGGKVKKSA